MLPTWQSKFELKPGKWVFVPTVESLRLGKNIKSSISARWHPPYNYFHLRAGGHVKALESHRHNSMFATLDITDFFGSINKTRVTRCLKGLYSYPEARKIADLSTVVYPGEKHFILPFGFAQSPVLASLCLAQSALGKSIHQLKRKFMGLTASVYVDDIVLSSNSSEDLTAAMLQLKEAAARSAFKLNEKKEQGPAPQITAFNIQLNNLLLEIEPERYTKFLAAFTSSDSVNEREGILSYINSVNVQQANKMGPA